MSESAPASMRLFRASATRFIVLLGLVSLCADMTYEGARSVTGPYLGILGASAAMIGVVASGGELLRLRLAAPVGLSHRPQRRVLAATFLGYGVNLVAVPLLAWAGSWELAVLLIVAERAGKAIRALILLWRLSLLSLGGGRNSACLGSLEDPRERRENFSVGQSGRKRALFRRRARPVPGLGAGEPGLAPVLPLRRRPRQSSRHWR